VRPQRPDHHDIAHALAGDGSHRLVGVKVGDAVDRLLDRREHQVVDAADP
jgi:hypothetical protein